MPAQQKDRAPGGASRPLSSVQVTTTNSRQHSAAQATDQFPVIVARLVKNRREQLRVALEKYQGVELVDLRVTVELTEASGVQIPTKQGVSLRLEQLDDLIEALQSAAARACELGLTDGSRR